jgi:predicted O-methyltransferase YrrM
MNFLQWLTHPVLLIHRLHYFVWEKLHPDLPWLCPGTVRFCSARLTKSMRVLEFGSGRSTTWFAQRVTHLTSVENHADWHRVVSERLRAQNVTNVDYRLLPFDIDVKEEPVELDPMPAYVRVADEFADSSLDLVIVDGYFRNHCIRRVAPKIKSGGYLLVDDTDLWPTIEKIPVPPAWKIVDDSTNGLKRCIIWQVV